MQILSFGASVPSAAQKRSNTLSMATPTKTVDQFSPNFGMAVAFQDSSPSAVIGQIEKKIQGSVGADAIIKVLREEWLEKKYSASQSDSEALMRAVSTLRGQGSYLAKDIKRAPADIMDSFGLQDKTARLETLRQTLRLLQPHIRQALQDRDTALIEQPLYEPPAGPLIQRIESGLSNPHSAVWVMTLLETLGRMNNSLLPETATAAERALSQYHPLFEEGIQTIFSEKPEAWKSNPSFYNAPQALDTALWYMLKYSHPTEELVNAFLGFWDRIPSLPIEHGHTRVFLQSQGIEVMRRLRRENLISSERLKTRADSIQAFLTEINTFPWDTEQALRPTKILQELFGS